MIRKWTPWGSPDPEPEPDPDPQPEPEAQQPTEPEPVYDSIIYDPDGPLACQRDDEGRYLPGTSGTPQTMFRPGVDHRRRSKVKGVPIRPSIPFQHHEIDHAIAHRLRENLALPDTQALDRLTLFARRVVDDAMRGRPYAMQAVLERLQPQRARPRQEVEISGMVAHTVIVGPQGEESEARDLHVYDVLPEPPQADEDD